MTSSKITADRGIYRGWIVVAVTFGICLATAGAMSMPGLLLVPLQQEFGWSNATMSGALSLRTVVFGLIAPLVRLGIRVVMLPALRITTAGIGLTAFVSQSWQLSPLWGLVLSSGTGLTALVLGATVANIWLYEKRVLVIGLMTASSALGRAIVRAGLRPNRRGPRTESGIFSVPASLAILVPIAAMRNRPVDVNFKAYGAPNDLPAPTVLTEPPLLPR